MNKNDIAKIQNLKYKIYDNDADLKEIIFQLKKYLKVENEKENIVELALGKAYYEKKEYLLSMSYFRAAFQKNSDCPYYYLGLFKNHMMLSNYEVAYQFLLQYKDVYVEKNIQIDTSLLEALFKNLFTGYTEEYTGTNRYLLSKITDSKVKELYNMFISYYNVQEYKRASKVCKDLDYYCKSNQLSFDFAPLLKLINALQYKKEHQEKALLDDYYKKLEIAYQAEDCEVLQSMLKVVCAYPLKKRDLIFQSIYILLKNNYCEDAKRFLNQIVIFKQNEFEAKILWNEIANQEKYNALNDYQKEVYQNAVTLGHSYYRNFDVFTAFDIYSWGYYVTNQDIFLYYMGKMFYKNGNYIEAKKYLTQYIKTGSSLLAKAYLYLGHCEFKCLNPKKDSFLLAKNYMYKSQAVDKLFGEEFETIEIASRTLGEDFLKLQLQNKELFKKRKND